MGFVNSFLLFIISVQILVISYLLYDVGNGAAKTTTNRENFSHVHRNIVSKHLPEDFFTSVFCTGTTKKVRECRFQNLCFDPIVNKYIYFHSKLSKEFGVPFNSSKPVLLDLSSVNDHNAKYFHHVDALVETYSKQNMTYVTGKSILFHRFNPENIMHVIHDDLLPWYHTRRKYFPTDTHVNAVMLDGRNAGPYFDLYQIFMDFIITKDNISKLTCFEDVIVGISKTTTWYQYGFYSPQGPIYDKKYPTSELFYFVHEFKLGLHNVSWTEKEEIQSDGDDNQDCIVYISRKTTRRIVNEMNFILKLSSHFSMPVHMVDLQYDPFDHIVSQISNARVLISVHGAQLILSMFLPPEATVIEIFPFGIPAENYTPYKTLANLMKFNYIAWENKIESNTYPHPDWPPDLGGIVHLSKEMQTKILETKSVPEHLCCHNPFWLFRIYQDTNIDIVHFLDHMNSSRIVNKSGNVVRSNLEHFYPEFISVGSCLRINDGEINITWNTPWNVEWAPKATVAYEIILRSEKENNLSEKEEGETSKKFVTSTYYSVGVEFLHLRNVLCNMCSVQIRCILNKLNSDWSENIPCVA